jgi:hypothetical protein
MVVMSNDETKLLRDWRIWAEIAAVLVRRARKLYVRDDIGLDLANTVYALDSTTIDLCLSLFPWADFRSTKAAVHSKANRAVPLPTLCSPATVPSPRPSGATRGRTSSTICAAR